MSRYAPVTRQLERLITELKSDMQSLDATSIEYITKQAELLTTSRVLNITVLDQLGLITTTNNELL